MISALIKAFFCLSPFAFLGTHARTLPAEDTFKISNTYKWTSIMEKVLTPPPAPKVAPPHRPVTSISYATGTPCDIIRRWSKAHPPPPPHVQKNAYSEWNSIFAIYKRAPADPSYRSPQIAAERHKGVLMSSNYLTTDCPHEEITKRPKSLAPPPPAPRVAPPHIETSAYCAAKVLQLNKNLRR